MLIALTSTADCVILLNYKRVLGGRMSTEPEERDLLQHRFNNISDAIVNEINTIQDFLTLMHSLNKFLM